MRRASHRPDIHGPNPAQLRILSLLLLTPVMSLCAPASVWAALSASVADMAFPALSYSHGAQSVTGSLTLDATDTGSGGLLGTTNAGWNVTIQSSALAYSGPNAGTAIPAANLAITAAHPPTWLSGQQISPSGGPRTTNVTGSLDVARKTLQADGPSGVLVRTYYGIGTYRQIIDVSLSVPGQSRAGTYTSTLTVTMSAGP